MAVKAAGEMGKVGEMLQLLVERALRAKRANY